MHDCQVKHRSHSLPAQLCAGWHCHPQPSSTGPRYLVTMAWCWGVGMLSTVHNTVFLFWTPYLLDQRAQIKGCEGGLLCRLHNYSVPTAERRRQLPHQHQQREVPLQQNTEDLVGGGVETGSTPLPCPGGPVVPPWRGLVSHGLDLGHKR